MSLNVTSSKTTVGQCPACGVNIDMIMQIDFEVLSVNQSDGCATAEGKVVGASTVAHNCIPRTTRRS